MGRAVCKPASSHDFKLIGGVVVCVKCGKTKR